MRSEPERRRVNPVPRLLVVEREVVTGVSDLDQPPGEIEPARRARRDRGERPLPAVCRLQRIARQQVLQVGDDELLVLLLVMDAELDQRQQRCVRVATCEEALHALVDVTAVREHAFERRT